MNNIKILENKNVLITGASGGLGRSLCKKFGNCNTNIYAMGRSKEKLIELSNEYKIKNYYCCNLYEKISGAEFLILDHHLPIMAEN